MTRLGYLKNEQRLSDAEALLKRRHGAVRRWINLFELNRHPGLSHEGTF